MQEIFSCSFMKLGLSVEIMASISSSPLSRASLAISLA